MKVNVIKANGWVTVKIVGRIDNFTYPILENDIKILLKTGVKKLQFDMMETSHISMSFIRLIKSTQEELQNNGGRLVIQSMNEEVKERLDRFIKSDQLQVE